MAGRVAVLVATALVMAAACSGGSTGSAGSVSDTVQQGGAEVDPGDDSADPTASGTGVADTGSIDAVADADQPTGPVADPVRHPFTSGSIYFVMPDRFENGDPANDTGGLDGGPLETGFLPTDRAYHHGGDLAGLTARLPYIADMGFSAVWITPPFTNRFVQGDGTIDGSSSSYHGYWQVDWDTIDPHLGTDQEMRAFVDAAHALGIAVVVDAVVNHTGDVISFAEDSYVYRSTRAAPYRDADGNEFDPAQVAGSPDFPPLDPAVSFAYTPVFSDPADATAKSPDWLNDPTLYHNRGNSTFTGDSVLDGDFFGLDDLFTEHPRVVEGMTEIYSEVIDRYGIDGYRVDTMKHVDLPFWRHWTSTVLEQAIAADRPDFFIFGEIASTDPILGSSYTNAGVPATLDFGLDTALGAYVAGGTTGQVLADTFDNDDWYTDADNNASMQVTFFGNHDGGRMGAAIARGRPGADDAELLDRMRLGFDLLFLTRGVPVVYYGDEQGFTGEGGDQLARQSMFPSVTPEYIDDEQIGTDATPAADNFDPTHPLYRHIGDLNRLRVDHPTLATGAQIVHLGEGPIVAFSRFDREQRFEYVVVSNTNRSLTVPARFAALSPNTEFVSIRPAPSADAEADTGVDTRAGAGVGEVVVNSDESGEMLVEVPPLGVVVLRAETPLPRPETVPEIEIIRPDDGALIPTPRYRIQAELRSGPSADGTSATGYAEVTFAVAVDGAEPQVVGVDDAPPYRVYWDTTAAPDGAEVEILVTVENYSGIRQTDRIAVTLGERP